MATELDAARALVYRAAILKDKGGDNVSRAASMAKVYATEAAFHVVDQALQIHGGWGHEGLSRGTSLSGGQGSSNL